MSVTTESLLDLIRDLQLVEKPKLEGWLNREGNLPGVGPEPLIQGLIAEGLLTRFQGEQLLRGRGRALILRNKYRVIDLLGAGGMGKVLLCEHIILQRLVAVKILPAGKVNDPEIVERFYNEARAVAALKHRNIVSVYDIERDEKMPLMVMEYIEGRDLDHLVRRHGPINALAACHFIAQAACGLQHAHESGLVHRDIKPSNLLLDREGIIRILDMGLARFLKREGESITQKYSESAILGTAEYLSPEQALTSTVDIRADIYSLGATFFFLLTGQPPFVEETIAQKLMAHQLKPAPSVLILRPDLDPGLDRIIAKMLAKEPDDRFRQPGEVAEALAPWAAQADLATVVTSLLGGSLIRRNLTVTDTFPAGSNMETLPLGKSTSRMPREDEPAGPTRWKWYLGTIASAVLTALVVVIWMSLNSPTPAGSVTGTEQAKALTPEQNQTDPPIPPVKETPKETQPEKKTDPVVEPKKEVSEVPPEEAGKYIGKNVVVTLKVQSTWYPSTKHLVVLYSVKDFQTPGALGIMMHKTTADREYPEYSWETLDKQFEGKTIRVTGKVSDYKGKTQIEILKADQITILKE